MHRPILGLLLAALFVLPWACSPSTPGQDGATKAAAAAPKIQLAEDKFDFGDVDQGAKATHVFTVKNMGLGALHIKGAKGS